MTCQECEIKLGMGEDANEHLARCGECRALERELRLNSVALREMRVRPVMHWQWTIAAAAAMVMAIGVWKMPVTPKHEVITAAHGAAPQQTVGQVSQHQVVHKKRRVRKPVAQTEPLRVKMFTSDPDVVIYWIVDKKEGFE
jgi:hypothetical protein